MKNFTCFRFPKEKSRRNSQDESASFPELREANINYHELIQALILLFLMKRIPSIKELNEQIHKTKNQQINYIFNIRVFDFDFRSLLRLESNVDRMEFSNFKEEIRKRI